ncbi:MAG: hypothetical protein AAFU71_06730 [Cyanobacteria bacterium J06632_22]
MKSLLRNLPAKTGFALIGLGYFQVFSHLDVSPLFRNYLLIMPLQVGALGYVAYYYWQRRNAIRQATIRR